MVIKDSTICELNKERERQIDKGFDNEWDDSFKTPDDWCTDIDAYVTWAKQMARMRSPEKYRRRMVQVATIAIAAIESFDRVNK